MENHINNMKNPKDTWSIKEAIKQGHAHVITLEDAEKETKTAFLKASERVGIQTQNIMKWVLKFIHCDLENLSKGDFWNLQDDMVYLFKIGKFGLLGKTEVIQEWLSRSFQISGEKDKKGKTILQSSPDLDEDLVVVNKIQNLYKKAIDSVLLKKGFKLDLYDPFVVFNPPDEYSTKWYIEHHQKWCEGIYVNNIIELLVLYADYIHKCPGCEIIFLADRINQKFCSHKCQSRQAMRKIQGVSPERYGKRGRPKKEGNGGSDHGKEKQQN